MINSVLHGGYRMKRKGHVRITITERFNPLQNIPYLKKTNAPFEISYTANYNKIRD